MHTRPWLKPVLVQCAWAAARSRGTYLNAQYMHLRGRRGPKKAIVAVAGSILTSAYHMLRDGSTYRDLGPQHFTIRDRSRVARRLARRLQELGYHVELRDAA